MHDELLAHQAFLERLARRLVTDEAAAQDLVQDTWLQAIARPPRERRALRVWLGTVARRLAGERARGGRRRREREQAVARREAVEDGLERVDRRLDFQAVLLERVRALPAAQRHALALRYVEGLTPHEIARQLGVSVTTVKARLRRGLATLRAELDREAGGERRVWALALLPELGRGAVPIGAGWGALGLTAGGISMTAGTKAAAGLLTAAVLAGGWWLAGDLQGRKPDGPAAPLAGARERARETEPLPVEVPASGVPDAAEAISRVALDVAGTPGDATAALGAEPRWKLHIELAGDFSGEPARVAVRGRWDSLRKPRGTDVLAELERPGGVLVDVGELVAALAAQGTRLPLKALVVEATHPDCIAVSAEVPLGPQLDPGDPPAESLEVRLDLQRGAVIVGRVEPPGRQTHVLAVEHAGEAWSSTPIALERCAPDGSFRLVVPRDGPHLVGAAAPGLRPASQVLELLVGSELDIGILRCDAGAAIAGVVLGSEGSSQGPRITARREDGWRPLAASPFIAGGALWGVSGDRLEWGHASATADGEGRFELEGLVPRGSYVLTVDPPPGPKAAASLIDRPWNPLPIVAPARDVVLELDWSIVELVLELPRETLVRGTIRFDMGIREPRPRFLHNALLHSLYLPPRTAGALDLELVGFLPERLEIVTPIAGKTVVVNVEPVRDAQPTALTLVLEGSLPPEGTPFLLRDLDEPSFGTTNLRNMRLPGWTDQRDRGARLQGGTLLFEGLPACRRHLLLHVGGSAQSASFLLDAEITVHLSPGEHAERRVDLIEGGRLRLDVTGADGRRAAARAELVGSSGAVRTSFLAKTIVGHSISFERLANDSPNDVVPNLPAGRYRLRLELEGHVPEEIDVEVRAGERTDVQVQMRRT